jgi:hypothetical protein
MVIPFDPDDDDIDNVHPMEEGIMDFKKENG